MAETAPVRPQPYLRGDDMDTIDKVAGGVALLLVLTMVFGMLLYWTK